MLRTLISLALLLTLVVPGPAEASKKKKRKKKGEPPPIGWQKEDGWVGSCYFPPDFSAMSSGERRMAWQETRNALMKQWQGGMGDGIQFGEKVLTNLETALLAKPERIEQVAQDNLKHCTSAMSGQGAGAWEGWINALPAQLTAGECPNPPLDYTLFDYLNIGVEWHIPAYVCKGDNVRITASSNDFYRIADGGPWINAEGDKEQPASGPLPCNIEGCYRGQLIMRFTGESGVVTVKPVGITTDFLAPEHGKIEVMINDDSWYDNEWKTESGITHHTSIEYSPAK